MFFNNFHDLLFSVIVIFASLESHRSVGDSLTHLLPLLKKMSSIPPSKSVKAMSLWWLPPFVPLI